MRSQLDKIKKIRKTQQQHKTHNTHKPYKTYKPRNTHKRNTKNKTAKKHKKVKSPPQIKQMNCHPSTKGKRLNVMNSCYTPQILEQIKDAYNKGHPTSPIEATDPTEIWKQLREKLKDCPTEDCWLKELKDEKMRKRIDRYIFAPDQPYEWNENPNEWLSNYDILNVLEQYETTYPIFDFIGPTPIDFDTKKSHSSQCVYNDLCSFSLKQKMKEGKKKIGVIFNTDPHTKSGSHWISMFIDVDEKLIYFFDSAGDKPPKEVDVLAQRIMEQGKQLVPSIHFEYMKNHPNQHQKGGTECGMYSLFFIITMLTGEKEGEKLDIQQRIKLFSKDKLPDKFAEKYRDIYFNEPPADTTHT